MPRRNRWRFALVALSCAAAAWGCTKSTAPPDWRPSAEESLSDPYGAWVWVEYTTEDSLSRGVGGELLAATTDSLYLLDTTVFRAVATRYVRKATAEAFDPAAAMGWWVVLGVLSTASHGWHLVWTAPSWIILGTLANGEHSRDPLVVYPKEPLARLQQFARFPQGLPPGLDRARVAPKRSLRRDEAGGHLWDTGR